MRRNWAALVSFLPFRSSLNYEVAKRFTCVCVGVGCMPARWRRSDFRIVLGGAHVKEEKKDGEEYLRYFRTLNRDTTEYDKDNAQNVTFGPKRKEVMDFDNGPRCHNVRVEQVFGGHSISVSVTFEITRLLDPYPEYSATDPRNPRNPANRPAIDADKCVGVISNRWSISESLDEEFKTSIAISGTLVVKSREYKPMAMRLMVTPLMFPYAKMASRSFQTDPTGLRLDYTYVMREHGIAPPPGIANWEASYIEDTKEGGITMASVDARVKGTALPPINSVTGKRMSIWEYKQFMISVLYRIIQSRLHYKRGPFAAVMSFVDQLYNTRIINIRVIESVHDNSIQMSAVARITESNVIDSFGLRLQFVGWEIVFGNQPYDPRWWPIPDAYPWDHAGATEAYKQYGTFYDCYLQKPYTDFHAMPRAPIGPEQQSRPGVTQPTATKPSLGNPGSLGFAGLNQETLLPVPPNPNPEGDVSILVNPNLPAHPNVVNGDHPPGKSVKDYGLSASTGIADRQLAGATYFTFRGSAKYETISGQRNVPLSVPRTEKVRRPNGEEIEIVNHTASIRLFPDQAKRTIQMVATRLNAPPEIPQMLPMAIEDKVIAYMNVAEVMYDSPMMTDTGQDALYSAEVKYQFVLSQPPAPPQLVQGSTNSYDQPNHKLRYLKNPQIKEDYQKPIEWGTIQPTDFAFLDQREAKPIE